MSNFNKFKDYLNLNTIDNNYHSISSEYHTESEFNLKYNSLTTNNIKISIMHVNIRSLNANYTKLQQLLLNLHLQFDVIVLSEIWTNNIEFMNNILPNYKLFCDLPDYSNVGGVGIFVNKNLSTTIRDDLKIKTSTYKIENIFIEIKKRDKIFIVGGIYRHPNSQISNFKGDLDALFHRINKKQSKNIECVIMGDINIDLLKYESHNDIKEYIDSILANNFLPLSFIQLE